MSRASVAKLRALNAQKRKLTTLIPELHGERSAGYCAVCGTLLSGRRANARLVCGGKACRRIHVGLYNAAYHAERRAKPSPLVQFERLERRIVALLKRATKTLEAR